ncbi:WD40 repeat-like protein, partial [Sporormia fimetaria CBS 119925]
MTDRHNETLSVSGLRTPPLSPSKSISTAGWTTPRTPASPRKARSCHFIKDGPVPRFSPTPPASPHKTAFSTRLSEYASAAYETCEHKPLSALAVKAFNLHKPEHASVSPLRISTYLTRSNNRSAPEPTLRDTHEHLSPCKSLPPRACTPVGVLSPSRRRKSSSQNSSESCPPPSTTRTPLTSPKVRVDAPRCRTPPAAFLRKEEEKDKSDLKPIPLRVVTSPLRPSQWTSCGGLLSSPPSSGRDRDRFISARRPPNVSRESFELNKPFSRVVADERISRGARPLPDPFSRRLHRSGRLDEELQTLRETHSVLTGRINPSRRGANVGFRRNSQPRAGRQVSPGGVWTVGGASAASDTVVGVSNGRGGVLGSGTNAPLYTSMFLSRADPEAELEAYEGRLALALQVDQSDRILGHTSPAPSNSTTSASGSSPPSSASPTHHVWKDNEWTKEGTATVLDAPQLRDDYYCSVLAYSHSAKCLAVGLGNFVHLWSERKGVDTPQSVNALTGTAGVDVQHVTSLAFSSTQGGQAILAVGRADGRLTLWSPFDAEPRFNVEQPKPISCVSFRPCTVKRPSLRDPALTVSTEELIIGDEAGHIYLYSVEWPNEIDSSLFGWHGAMTLLARMTMHTQQICGLAWSPDGEMFASGGNDNVCFLFETKKILQHRPGSGTPTDARSPVRQGPNGERITTVTPGRDNVLSIQLGREKHRWELNAAVKAIAFCPWQRGLLAIGGGSNDRCIHFYHTLSGACLATIDCAAQVTSLMWSTTRREIAATFGFAQPEHPYRIAVFAWPSCEQRVAIPWFDENRALYAIPYPGGPNTGRERGEDGVWSDRAREEGCVVVAASDAAIRFHEIWSEDKGGLGAS